MHTAEDGLRSRTGCFKQSLPTNKQPPPADPAIPAQAFHPRHGAGGGEAPHPGAPRGPGLAHPRRRPLLPGRRLGRCRARSLPGGQGDMRAPSPLPALVFLTELEHPGAAQAPAPIPSRPAPPHTGSRPLPSLLLRARAPFPASRERNEAAPS